MTISESAQFNVQTSGFMQPQFEREREDGAQKRRPAQITQLITNGIGQTTVIFIVTKSEERKLTRKIVAVVKSLQSCLTLLRLHGLQPTMGSSVHGIFQARMLEWVAISFSRGIFLDHGLNACLLHWQADSLTLSHQGSPSCHVLMTKKHCSDVWVQGDVLLKFIYS